jgi:hypothetical protein
VFATMAMLNIIFMEKAQVLVAIFALMDMKKLLAELVLKNAVKMKSTQVVPHNAHAYQVTIKMLLESVFRVQVMNNGIL